MIRFTVYTPTAEYSGVYAYSPADACRRVFKQLYGRVRFEDIYAVAR